MRVLLFNKIHYVSRRLFFILLIFFCCSVSAYNRLYFNLLNSVKPTLQQQVRVHVYGWDPFAGDPPFRTGDKFYFITYTPSAQCAGPPPSTVNTFNITYNAQADVAFCDAVMKKAVFTVGFSYTLCYWSQSVHAAFPATFSVNGKAEPFVVLEGMFKKATMVPLTVYGGQGPISVYATEINQTKEGQPLNQGNMVRQPVLIPCSESSCENLDELVTLCSSAVNGMSALSTTGFKTLNITTRFVISRHVQPNQSYALCIPYCVASEECATEDYPLSWGIVGNGSTSFSFLAENPAVYNVTPTGVEAHQLGRIHLYGSGLTSRDKVRIIAKGYSCAAESPALLPNLIIYNISENVNNNSTECTIDFKLADLPSFPVRGQVCYSRAEDAKLQPEIWAPVYQSKNASSADFVIDVMEPTGFSVETKNASVGSSVLLQFKGSGLNAKIDAAFLSYAPSMTCYVSKGFDPCDGTDPKRMAFPCILSDFSNSSVNCKVVPDPKDVSESIKMCVCYRRGAGDLGFALVAGTLRLGRRNPYLKLSPYPVYGGEMFLAELIGTGFELTDKIKAIPLNALCDTAAELPNVSFSSKPQLFSSNHSYWAVTGYGGVCFDICYYLTSLKSWTVARRLVPHIVHISCSPFSVYIMPAPAFFSVTHSNPAAAETVQIVVSTSINGLMILETTSNACTQLICEDVAPCNRTMPSTDFASASDSLFMVTKSSSYIICIDIGAGAFLPIPSDLSPNGTFLMSIGSKNPTAFQLSPPVWRVFMALPRATFTGHNFSLNNDTMRIFVDDVTIGSKACPLYDSPVHASLTSQLIRKGSTEERAVFDVFGTDGQFLNVSMTVCYYHFHTFPEGNWIYVPNKVGHLKLEGAVPSSMTYKPKLLRAGHKMVLNFTSTLGDLSPSTDRVYFYRPSRSNSTIADCRCDPFTCSGLELIYDTSVRLVGDSKKVSYLNSRGFNNYIKELEYTVCYNVSAVERATYMGWFSVLMAQPTYFYSNRLKAHVGQLVTVVAVPLCQLCPPLSTRDSMILIESSRQCVDVRGYDPKVVQLVGNLTFTRGSGAEQSFVLLVVGKYRVCYRLENEKTYSELMYGQNVTEQLLEIGQADPFAFEVIPKLPSQGEFLTLNITMCESACTTCSMLRLLPGSLADCWLTKGPSLNSTVCALSPTVMKFPRVYIPSGVYTLCYGSVVKDSRRIPGNLSIALASPSFFLSTNDNIYPNQASNVTLTFPAGSDKELLQDGDSVFVLPHTPFYDCQDLSYTTIDIISNATLAKWFSPATSPYPLIVASTGKEAKWVITNFRLRFSQDIVTHGGPRLCSEPGERCALQVCYFRNGKSWAKVTEKEGQLYLYSDNPTSVSFDTGPAYRVTQYVLATVRGKKLPLNGELFFTDGSSCEESDKRVAVPVSPAEISSTGDTWRAVLKFERENMHEAMACFRFNKSTAQVMQGPPLPPGSILPTMWYTLLPHLFSPQHVLSRLEFAVLGILVNANATEPVRILKNITINEKTCTYHSFPKSATEVYEVLQPVKEQKDKGFFEARMLHSGAELALCVYAKDGRTFSVPNPLGMPKISQWFVVGPETPLEFVTEPRSDMILSGMAFNITFLTYVPQPCYTYGVCADLLGGNDTVQIIHGSKFECGFSNTTVVANFTMSFLGNSTVTSAKVENLVVSATSANPSDGFTVCYKKWNSTASSVPSDGKDDRNLVLAPLYPTHFTVTPEFPSVLQDVAITFYSGGQGLFQDLDSAKLVSVPLTQTRPFPQNCTLPAAYETQSVHVESGGNISVWDKVIFSARGHFVVCYRLYGGGFSAVMHPGLLFVGPVLSYSVSPLQLLFGQTANLSIVGPNFTKKDRAKVVDVHDEDVKNYSTYCTAEAPNADGEHPGKEGVEVFWHSKDAVEYSPRLNFSSEHVILCYKRSLMEKWIWVSPIPYFSVASLNPAVVLLVSSDTYTTQRISLVFKAQIEATISSKDEIRIVDSGTGVRGFDCHASAANSTLLTTAIRDSVSASESHYRICTSNVNQSSVVIAQWTICYKVENGTWAAVPIKAQDSYSHAVYKPLVVNSLPWGPPKLPGTIPRSFELFNLNFNKTGTASYTGQRITNAFAVSSPSDVCQMKDYALLPTAAVVNATDEFNDIYFAIGGSYDTAVPLLDISTSKDLNKNQLLFMLGTELRTGTCNPCSFTPDYGAPGVQTMVNVSGSSLTVADSLTFVLASDGPAGCVEPAAHARGPFGGKIFLPRAVSMDAKTTYFSVPIPADSLGSLLVLCYAHSDKKKSGEPLLLNFAAISNASGYVDLFRIVEPFPRGMTRCPSDSIYFGQTYTLNFTVSQEYGALSTDDRILVAPAAVKCADAARSPASRFGKLVSVDKEGRWASFNIITAFDKSVHSKEQSHWCYAARQLGGSFVQVLDNFSTLPLNPSGLIAKPHFPPVNVSNLVINITGTILGRNDDIYIIDSNDPSVDCEETCTHHVVPKTFNNSGQPFHYIVNYDSVPTSVVVTVHSPIVERVLLGLCYRISGLNLARLKQTIRIGPPNPKNWSVNFVPRVGTRPTLKFIGVNLTIADDAHLVPVDADCDDDSRVVAVGVFVNATNITSFVNFTLTGTSGGVKYRVCYRLAKDISYADVQPFLTIHVNPISEYNGNNRPMAGRAINISFPQFSTNSSVLSVADRAKLICGTCSCYENSVNLTIPFGSPFSLLPVELKTGPVIRIGLVRGLYKVCYRINDSGFAPVGKDFEAIPPVPLVIEAHPWPTIYQGERISFKLLAGSHTAVNFSKKDDFMVVYAARECWKTPSEYPSQIIARTQGDKIRHLTPKLALLDAHIPSLGPDMNKYGPYPMNIAICVCEAGQEEYVKAAYKHPPNNFTVLAASPTSFISVPKKPENGLVNVTVTFSSAPGPRDKAYAVAGSYTDMICTDSDSEILSDLTNASPMFIFTPSTIRAEPVTFCFVRVNGTVAEVPVQLELAHKWPLEWRDGYSSQRFREYLNITIIGSKLDASTDIIVPSEKRCGAYPLEPSPYINKATFHKPVQIDPDHVNFSIQLLPNSAVNTSKDGLYICYKPANGLFANIWFQIPRKAVYVAATPLMFSLDHILLRQGQQVKFNLSGLIPSRGDTLNLVKSIDASGYGWCSNVTDTQEPNLKIVDSKSASLAASYWQTIGIFTLCTCLTERPWADVAADLFSKSSTKVLGPNPASMSLFPFSPRVGQRVVFSFQLAINYDPGDLVKIVLENSAVSCADATPLPSGVHGAVATGERSAVYTPVDSRDPHGYASFLNTGVFTVCYYAAAEGQWAAAGGLISTAEVQVSSRVPDDWVVYTGLPIPGIPFSLAIMDFTQGVLDASSDSAWLTPSTEDCANSRCSQCVSLTLNAALSNSSHVVTFEVTIPISRVFGICYQLTGATASRLLMPLNVSHPGLVCVSAASPLWLGRYQNVLVHTLPGVNTSSDKLRFSFSAGTAIPNVDCRSTLVPDFPDGRAIRGAHTSTTATFFFEFPVAMNDTSYGVCYFHQNAWYLLCPCGNAAACNLPTRPALPHVFNTSFSPTYVGQRVTVNVFSSIPLHKLRLVHDNSFGLRTCESVNATVAEMALVRSVEGIYSGEFKSDYRTGPMQLMVCVISKTWRYFARVPAYGFPYNSHVDLRLFMRLSVKPTNKEFWRVDQTLQIKLKHESNRIDDKVTSHDSLALVYDRSNCDEPYIDNNETLSRMDADFFELNDTDVKQWPGVAPIVEEHEKAVLAYFVFKKIVKRTLYICFRPSGQTWAPVINSGLQIGAPFTGDCKLVSQNSTENNFTIGGHIPAWMYAHFFVSWQALHIVSNITDHILSTRIVPQTSMCINASNAVYSYHGSINKTGFLAILLAPHPGDFKLCIRFDGESLFSPACVHVPVVASIVDFDVQFGCFLEGQTLKAQYARVNSPGAIHVFSTNDRYRGVGEKEHCDYLLPDCQKFISALWLNRVPQSNATGAAFIKITASGADATLASLFLSAEFTAQNISGLRMCYTDAVGNQFAMPLSTNLTSATISVYSREPVNYSVFPLHPQRRQLIRVTYEALDVSLRRRPFTPSEPQPYPWHEPIPPPRRNQWDVHALFLLDSTPRRDGDCAAALETFNSKASLVLSSIVGTNISAVGRAEANVEPGSQMPCYALRGCSLTDLIANFTVHGENPSSGSVNPAPPRRGQLFEASYTRSSASDALPLTPGKDRGGAAVDNCWDISPERGGYVAHGSTNNTVSNAIVYAIHPDAPPQRAHLCYILTGASWASVFPYEFDILPANPTRWTTIPSVPAANTIFRLMFVGENLGVGDVAKIILGNPGKEVPDCTDDTLPEEGTYQVDPKTQLRNKSSGGPAGRLGWPVSPGTPSPAITGLYLTVAIKGNYSVCYRIANESKWTLLYGALPLWEGQPGSTVYVPASALEGEMLTVNAFKGSRVCANSQCIEFSITDQIYIIFGEDNWCPVPDTSTVAIVRASPSLVRFIPANISFQIAAATRGVYQLCYQQYKPGSTEKVITWGFPLLTIGDNPRSYSTLPMPARVKSVFGILFRGFGLQSGLVKHDEVKILEPTNDTYEPKMETEGATDPCQTDIPPSFSFVLYRLKAFGNTSVAVFSSEGAIQGRPYIVCYKLYGGQYHRMAEPLALEVAEPPSVTIEPLREVYEDGAGVTVFLEYTGESCHSEFDFVFTSQNGCTEITIPLPPNRMPVDPAVLLPEASPISYDYVRRTESEETSDDQGQGVGNDRYFAKVRFPLPGNYSICLCSPKESPSGGIHVLVPSSIRVNSGLPAVNSTPIVVDAQAVFSVILAVPRGFSPSKSDIYGLVSNAKECGNKILHASSLFVTPLTVIGETLTFETAAECKGQHYVCFVRNESEACRSGGNCSRIVATVHASPADPNWFDTSPALDQIFIYESIFTKIFYTHSHEHPSEDELWAAHVTGGCNSAKGGLACVSTARNGNTANRLNFTYDSIKGGFSYPGVIHPGNFSFCYAKGTNTKGIVSSTRLFVPGTRCLHVRGADVFNVTITTLIPSVDVPVMFAIVGVGLRHTDECYVATNVPKQSKLPRDVCTNAKDYPHTSCTALLTPLPSHFFVSREVVVREVGSYALCYQIVSDRIASPVLGPFIVGPLVAGMHVITEEPSVGVPIVVEFEGAGLSNQDRAAFVELPNTSPGFSSHINNICDGANYFRVSWADGSKSNFSASVENNGHYIVCYAPYMGVSRSFATVIDVGIPPAVDVVFLNPPGQCKEYALCGIQPRLMLVDSVGHRAPDPSARFYISFINVDSGSSADAFVGRPLFTRFVNSADEWIFDLMFRVQGLFAVVVKVEFSNGDTAQVTSDSFKVSAGGNSGLFLFCDPFSQVLPAGSQFSCGIYVKLKTSPNNYTVSVSAGGHSSIEQVFPTPEELQEGVLRKFVFLVFTPISSKDEPPLNTVALDVRPVGINESVIGSPMTLFLSREPTAEFSSLECKAPSNSPAPVRGIPVIREGDSAVCTISPGIKGSPIGRWPVVCLGYTFILVDMIDSRFFSRLETPLPYRPEDARGVMNVDVLVRAGLQIHITCDIREREEAISGSPALFYVSNKPENVRIQCTSEKTGSLSLFEFNSYANCFLEPQGSSGKAIQSASGDYVLFASNKAVIVKRILPGLLELKFMFSIYISSSAKIRIAAGSRQVGVSDETFSIVARYNPDLFSFPPVNFTIIYVEDFTTPRGYAGHKTSMYIMGSGVTGGLVCAISSSTDCLQRSSTSVEVTPEVGKGRAKLSFKLPHFSPLYICYTTSDSQTKHFSLLFPSPVVPLSPPPRMSHTHLIILIVGLVLLALLLLVGLIMGYIIYMRRRRRRWAPAGDAVRRNDQYVRYVEGGDPLYPSPPRQDVGEVATDPPGYVREERADSHIVQTKSGGGGAVRQQHFSGDAASDRAASEFSQSSPLSPISHPRRQKGGASFEKQDTSVHTTAVPKHGREVSVEEKAFDRVHRQHKADHPNTFSRLYNPALSKSWDFSANIPRHDRTAQNPFVVAADGTVFPSGEGLPTPREWSAADDFYSPGAGLPAGTGRQVEGFTSNPVTVQGVSPNTVVGAGHDGQGTVLRERYSRLSYKK